MRRKTRGAQAAKDARLARRALKVLRKPDYVVTDIVHSRPKSPRRYDVVFVHQRWMGLPVYDGRRSVIFSRGKTQVTGRHTAIRSVTPALPTIGAADAVQAAAKRMKPKVVLGAIETVSTSAGLDRHTVLRVEPLPTPVMARLVVFVKRRARLAWLLTAEHPDGYALEAVVDAATKKVHHERGLSYHASACLAIATDAGGPPAAAPALKPTVDSDWLNPALRTIDCLKSNGSDATPVPAANGDVCGSAAGSIEETTVNAWAIANLGLARVTLPGGQTLGRVKMTIVNGAVSALELVALAIPKSSNSALKFTAWTQNLRHAASDPAVVLHELAHLVLSRGVGGSETPTPFENTGESGAIMEGLADFLGLTLWNSIRRTPIGMADVEKFGAWLMEARCRDYGPLIANPSTAPTFPFASQQGVHLKGMGLCLALWLTRAEIMSGSGFSADEADDVIWEAVCDSLPLMPHQGSRPHFCCVSKALRDAIDPAFLSTLTQKLADRKIPSNCPHVRTQ